MKLRNKKTGYVWDIPKMRHPTAQEDDISFFAMQDTVGTLFSYKSLAELNEEWEDYKPTEKKPRRYRLIKDLPTFDKGDEFYIAQTGALWYDGGGDDDVCAYGTQTLMKFPNILEEWFEPIEPTEPLIKDEKIRKAVRAWAEACGLEHFTVVNEHFNCCKIMGRKDNRVSKIGFLTTIPNATHQTYTIAELCGEEEAPEPLEPTFVDLDERIKEKGEE